MKPTKPENTAAFPRSAAFGDGCHDWGGEGMSLRDYFAAAALQGMLSSPHLKEAYAMEKDALAVICFGVADAMLAAREASNE